jgi:hypothetical protein
MHNFDIFCSFFLKIKLDKKEIFHSFSFEISREYKMENTIDIIKNNFLYL